METTENVYSAPNSNVEQENDNERMSSDEMKYFTFEGRINRLRYFSYYMGFALIMYLALGLCALVMMIPVVGQIVGSLGMFAVMIAAFIAFLSLLYRRCHDMNMSAWWLLLFFVPIVSLVFSLMLLFKPGTQSSNNFGKRPPVNSSGVKSLAWIGGVLFVLSMVGILAAVAIPAYSEFQERAEFSASEYETDYNSNDY